MDLDLECVASFLILCEEGHFGRAAARLHLTSPALTKRVQRLERQIGARLLDRGPAGTTSLTSAGWQFATDAGELIENARRAQQAAKAAAAVAPRRPIRIGIPGLLGAGSMMGPLTGAIRTLGVRFPDVALHCVGVPYSKVIGILMHRAVDVLWSPSKIEHPCLMSRHIGTLLRVGIVPSGHRLAGCGEIDVAEFSRLPMLYNPAVPPPLMAPGCLHDVRPLSEANLVPTTAQGVSSLQVDIVHGRGVAVLPLLPGMVAGAGLQSLTLLDVPPTECYAVYRNIDEDGSLLELVQLLREATMGLNSDSLLPLMSAHTERTLPK